MYIRGAGFYPARRSHLFVGADDSVRPTRLHNALRCHCEPVRTLAWQSVPHLAPTLGELAAKPTERVKIALSAPAGHLSHRERQVTLVRHGYAVPPTHYCAIANGN